MLNYVIKTQLENVNTYLVHVNVIFLISDTITQDNKWVYTNHECADTHSVGSCNHMFDMDFSVFIEYCTKLATS